MRAKRWPNLALILLWAVLLCLAGQASAQASRDKVESCSVFVQKFYDWYWNRFADKADDLNFDMRKLPTVDDALKLKPPVLSHQLTRLLRKDEAESRRLKGIVNLDFDPFLNSQDPRGNYVVGPVTVSGDKCEARIEAGNEIAVLNRVGNSWVFTNFLYGDADASGKARAKIESDLVQILSQ